MSFEALQQKLEELHREVTSRPKGSPRPLCVEDLQERGYTSTEAYELLKAHGVRLPGGRRRRIALSVLERIETGEIAP